MLVGRAWAGGAVVAGRVGTPGGPSLVAVGAVAGVVLRSMRVPGVRAAPTMVWQSFPPGQMGGIAPLGVRHAGDTP